nr:MAG TPA: hypothetical protein [Caudoviricetes sp.]
MFHISNMKKTGKPAYIQEKPATTRVAGFLP